MKFTNHQYMTKIFHFWENKLGITPGYSTFSMEALKANVLIWRMFMSSSMKAAIHLGPNYLVNLKVYNELRGNSELTQYISLMEEISIVSWSSDSMDKCRSTCPLRLRTVPGKDERKQRCNYKMGRSSGRIQNVPLENCWRSSWIRVEYFPRIYVIADSSEDPGWLARTEHRAWNIHRSDHLHVNVQRHRLEKERKWWNLYFEFRKSQGVREEILARTLDISGSWRRKGVVWNSSLHTWRKMRFYSQSNGGTIQRYRSSSIQEYWCF